ncbi:MAG TPA: protein translocase subunit SecF [Candidatus Nanoarchaeia archaeon]|nr:protein translocase subunit SecF [Candidatus Nanoarchaeia archaeon]
MAEENLQVKNWHDKYYKILLIIPAILIIFSFVYMINFYNQHGDFIKKDISLTGGTSVTLYDKLDADKLKQELQNKLEEVNIREVYDLISKEQKALIIETKSGADETKKVLEDYLKYELTDENSSFEFTGSSLSQGFYKQLLIAILVAFVAMGIVIFLIFRTFVPSIAVIASAFADILMTLVVVNILGIEISTAGLVAFLMLIGYSVDTDILLTSRVLKREGESLNKKIFDSFKTGMTMTLTALFSVLVALFIVKSFSSVLTQIFTILSIGLVFDIFNTWVTNVSIIKWYIKSKHG